MSIYTPWQESTRRVGPRVLIPGDDAPVIGCEAPTGLCRAENGWLVVQRGSVVASFSGVGAKRRAILTAGSNAVIV